MKTCSKCKEVKEFSCFGKLQASKDGHRAICNECRKEERFLNRDIISAKKKEHYSKNKEILSLKNKEYRYNNRDTINAKKKKYYESNREQILKSNKEYRTRADIMLERNTKRKDRRNNDIQFKLTENLRIRFSKATTGMIKAGSAVKNLGCSAEYFKSYIESMFTSTMSWDNYGKVWHIDHRYPLSLANLEDENEVKLVCHYTNMKPLEALKNLTKGSTLDLTDPIVNDIQNKINNIRRS